MRTSFKLAAGVLAGALAGTLAGCATGDSPFGSASTVELVFISAAQTWDVNKDNVVTCDEWKQYAGQIFRDADPTGSGALTPDQWAKMIAQDRLFETANHAWFDANKDGKVALAELTEKPNPAFTMLDKNKDCQITSDETVQMRQLEVKKDPSNSPEASQIPGGRR